MGSSVVRRSRSSSALVGIAVLVLVLIGAVLGLLMRGIRFDDPFITYRFAHHLAAGQGFHFNANASGPLMTTAPLYALLLSIPGALGIDIPTASYWVGVVALTTASLLLFTLGCMQGQPILGFIAAATLLVFPLNWLTMGFETPVFIAVALLAFVLVAHRQSVLAGIAGGIALGLRGDGAIVVALLVVGCWLLTRHRPTTNNQRKRSTVPLLVAAALTYAPLAVWLTQQFGSPLPTTLQTKSAQSASGLTGFYTGTTFPEGAWLLIQAFIQQSPLFAVVLIMMVIGLIRCVLAAIAVLRDGQRDEQGNQAVGFPLMLPIAWAVAHFAGYTLIRVAPYPWYYAPMLPGVACLVALGVDGVMTTLGGLLRLCQRTSSPMGLRTAARFSPWGRGVAGVLIAALTFVPLLVGDANIIAVLRGATPPPPSEISAKVLPETKVDVYERVGRWVDANTPATATLGVTELGVMSYYAQRHTVDFLGLTQPGQLDAIRRGDYLAGLLRTQPDYVALTNWNSLYDDTPQEDAWFRALYTQATAIDDARFWGSPMTVWRRTTPPITDSITLAEGAWDLGDGWQVTGVAVSARTVLTTTPLIVRVRLRAPSAVSWTQHERTLRVQPVTVVRGDGLPPWSRPIRTQLYRPGQEAWLDFPILPYPDARAGAYDISIRWEDGDTEVIAGRIKVPSNA